MYRKEKRSKGRKMKTITRIEVTDHLYLKQKTTLIDPLRKGEIYIKTKSIIITPLDVKEAYFRTNDPTFSPGMLLYGRLLEKPPGAPDTIVTIYSNCGELEKVRKSGLAKEIVPLHEQLIEASIEGINYPEMLFIYRIISSAFNESYGNTLLVNKMGLQGYLLASLFEENLSIYPSTRKRYKVKASFVSEKGLEEGNWDTVILWTTSQHLIDYVMERVENPRKIIVSPFSSCMKAKLPAEKIRKSILEVIWPNENYLDDHLFRLDSLLTKTKMIKTISVSSLPIPLPFEYTRVIFGE